MIRQGLFKIQKAAEGQQIVTQGYESWPREGASWEHDVVTWKGCHRHSGALLAVPGRSLSFHPFFLSSPVCSGHEPPSVSLNEKLSSLGLHTTWPSAASASQASDPQRNHPCLGLP